MSQNTVHCIFQDSFGFLWFGTSDGLNKYDGYEFEKFYLNEQDSTSISSNSISSIKEDSKHDIWITTHSGGLNRYNRNTGVFSHLIHDKNDSTTLSANRLKSIVIDNRDRVWIATEKQGIDRYDIETGRFIHYKYDENDDRSIPSNSINTVYLDRENTLWIGTAKGFLTRYNEDTDDFSRFNYATDRNGTHSLMDMSEDQDGILWLATQEGLFSFNKETGKFQFHYLDFVSPEENFRDRLYSICCQNKEIIWVGSYYQGLLKYNPITGETQRFYLDPLIKYSISSNRILSLFIGRSNILWIGTYMGGVNYIKPYANFFKILQYANLDKNRISSNNVKAIYQDSEGIFWIGDDQGGLIRYDRKKNSYKFYQHDEKDPQSLSQNTVSTIYEYHPGCLIVGTRYGGLNIMNVKTGKFKRFKPDKDNPQSLSNSSILTIFEDSDGIIWIGTKSGGLNRFSVKSEKFKRYIPDPDDPESLGGIEVWDILEDEEAYLWLATSAGLNKLNKETGKFTHISKNIDNDYHTGNNLFLCITENKDGDFWIGTYGGGLKKYSRKTGEFTTYTVENGLENNVVYMTVEDDEGYLWLSTNKGITRMNPATETFTNFDVEDGLSSREFNAGVFFKSKTGELFFGGMEGITFFIPAEYSESNYVPKVILTDLIILNKRVQPGTSPVLNESILSAKKIKLGPDNKIITIEYSAMNYQASGKTKYTYRLKGYDTDWNYVGNRRFATYTGLPQGEYEFQVKAENKYGIWNQNPTELEIIVIPPFYKTAWFRIFAGIFIVGTILILYKLRVSRIENQRKHLEKVVRERTRQLQNEREELKIANTKLLNEIEERRKAEKAVKESEERYRTLFNQASDAIFIEDQNERILDVNIAGCSLFGYSQEELLSLKTTDLIQGKNKSLEIYSNPDISYQSQIERTGRRKNGKEIFIEVSITSLHGISKTFYISHVRDITERKLAESESLKREKMQGVLELAGGVSHELTQPMQIVLGYSEILLQNAPKDSRSIEILDNIKNAIIRMSEITKRLRNITRYETISYMDGKIVDLAKSSDILVD